MKRKLKVNDFFCGCGGMGIAFKNAGYEIAGAWDFDKYAVETYRANVGDHVQKADIKELHQADIPQADVWAFGFPCQDLSVAGKQRGMILKCEDCGEEIEINPEEYTGNTICPKCSSNNFKAASRSGCFFEMMRLLEETEREREHAMPAEKTITPDTLAAGMLHFLLDSGIVASACVTDETEKMFAKHIKEELDGITIGETPEILRDWEAAQNAVNDMLSKYAPGGYMGKIIYPLLTPLKERLEAGERTPDLYNAIVEATR